MEVADQNRVLLPDSWEEFCCMSSFLPAFGADVYPLGEAYKDVFVAPSRYTSTLSFSERLALDIERKALHHLRPVKDAAVLRNWEGAVPLKWKKLFDYLYKAGITRHRYPTLDQVHNDEPKIYCIRSVAAPLKNAEYPSPYIQHGRYGFGASTEYEIALSKSLGELLERYMFIMRKDIKTWTASVRELRLEKKHFLDPFFVDQFAKWQKERFPAFRFDDESQFRWVHGKSLMTGKGALIPTQLAYWHYRQIAGEPVLRSGITSGAAGMFSRTEAIIGGIYEIIQRDGFLVYWLNSIVPGRIDPASVMDVDSRRLLDDCERYGIDVHILDTTTELRIPSVTVVLTDRYGGGPEVVVGAGCDRSPERAIHAALVESLSSRFWLRSAMEKGRKYALPESYEPFVSDILLHDRIVYWANPGMREKIQFFLSGPMRTIDEAFPEKRADVSPGQELAWLTELFRKKGPAYEIFCYEAEHEVLDAIGYHVIMSVIPAMLPMYLDETRAPLGHRRLHEACRALGYEPPEHPNLVPHPFP